MARVLITDHQFRHVEEEERVIGAAGHELAVAQAHDPEAVIAAADGAQALLVQWAPIDRRVLEHVAGTCRVVVRYGIGVDNVDLDAARELGVPVCNVPDYGVDEVADHAAALALTLVRQIPAIDRRVRSGVWDLTGATPMPACAERTVAVAGAGRIGRAFLERMRPFGFRLAAYDPFVDAADLAALGVRSLSLDELFAEADVLSLHLPLNDDTHHLVDAARLRAMKPVAIVVNTARGGLIDCRALARALDERTIAYAGLDVTEPEPLPDDHPLRRCDNAVLTSHVAWYSDASMPRLQRLAAEEAVRALAGQPLRCRVA